MSLYATRMWRRIRQTWMGQRAEAGAVVPAREANAVMTAVAAIGGAHNMAESRFEGFGGRAWLSCDNHNYTACRFCHTWSAFDRLQGGLAGFSSNDVVPVYG